MYEHYEPASKTSDDLYEHYEPANITSVMLYSSMAGMCSEDVVIWF